MWILILVWLSTFAVEEGQEAKDFSGVSLSFHEPFRLARLTSYWKGQRHGWELSWYPNGNWESERHYSHGLYDGVSQNWYEDGKLKTWRSYKMGKADGEQWSWGSAGQVQEYNRYEDDRELTHKTWTFDGKPFHNYLYQDGEKVGLQGEGFCKRKRSF